MSILANFNKQRPKLKTWISDVIEGLVDTGAAVTIISSQSWHPNRPLQYINVQFLGIGTLPQVK